MRRSLAALALLVAAVGCSAGGLSAEEQAQRCTDLADAVAKARLGTTPSRELAAEVARSLDNRLPRLGSPAIHDKAVELHRQLHVIELAGRRGDQDRADEAAEEARRDATELAELCDLPEERFLG